ncbi:MAG: hypothetical protein AAGJ87_01480 [Pseudomonadota bacterium]
MPNIVNKNFTRDHIITPDQSVAFRISDDLEKWPWLALPPSHAIVAQMVNYFCSVEAGRARGNLDTEKWTALTSTSWWCGSTSRNAPHGAHGVVDRVGEADDSPDYKLTVFNGAGGLVYRMAGRGVVFRNRDFEGWREKAKTEIAALPEPADFRFADREAACVATKAEVCVSPAFEEGDARAVDALFTAHSGFGGHPFHGGSGDHVNSGHQADAVQQAAQLLFGAAGAPLAIKGGEAKFKRYVELDRPFRIALNGEKSAPGRPVFDLSQGGHPCSRFSLTLSEGDG